jgi:hypothetical protein
MNDCKNCTAPINGKYCSNCGQPQELKRVDAHYIIHEIEHVLHLEKGILYTIRELLKNPGEGVRQFIAENRNRLVKPILFIIITSLIYTIVNHFFHTEQGYVDFKSTQADSTVNALNHWVQEHYGYANLLMGLFIGGWIKLFFRKFDYNFFEILILLCFVMGMGMLIFTVFAIAEGVTHISMMSVAGVAGIVYCCWGIGQFFGKRAIDYFKAFAAYLLGMVSFTVAIMLIGNLVDAIIKH